MIKTDLSRFVVTMHSGLCEQYIKSLDLTALGIDFVFTHTLMHCDNKPSTTGLNPLNQNKTKPN